MPNLAAGPLDGLLRDVHNKLTPFGFKKIDRPSSYADFMQYLERINFIDPDEPPAFRPQDHVWVRVEQNETGKMFHSIFVIPYDQDIVRQTPVVNLRASITPQEGGDIDDATFHTQTAVISIHDLLNMQGAFFASELSQPETPASDASASGASVLEAPTRPGTQPAGSTAKRALKALGAALRKLARRP